MESTVRNNGGSSTETLAAGTAGRRVGILHFEAALSQCIDIIELGTGDIQGALGIHHHADPGTLHQNVPVLRLVLKIHFVLQARTAPAHHGNPEDATGTPLLGQQRRDLVGRRSGQLDQAEYGATDRGSTDRNTGLGPTDCRLAGPIPLRKRCLVRANSNSRRGFLKTAAFASSAAMLPAWFLAEAADSPRPQVPLAANDRPTVALIGCGGMGRADARNARRFGDIVALCDVDQARLDEAQKDFPTAKRYTDFRDCVRHPGLHAVINGTPDHWHTLVNLAAVQAGKDIYSEKPLTLTLDEGRRLVDAVQQAGTVFQTGSQQRSDRRFRLAVELVRNGRIGTLRHVVTSLPSGAHGGPFNTTALPSGFDWNFWQGQTPSLAYVRERAHGSFRYWWEYSAGTLTDWGAHHNDIALWGLGETGPVEAEAVPLRDPMPGGFTVPSTYVVHYRYANGVTHLCRTVDTEGPGGNVLTPNTGPGQMANGILFEGSNGWIFVSRGTLTASDPALLNEPLTSRTWTAYVSDDHMGNFFDCIRTRKDPICSVEVGHRSVSVCHIGAISLRLGRPVRWDPKGQTFPGDRDAERWVAREQRKGFDYDMIS